MLYVLVLPSVIKLCVLFDDFSLLFDLLCLIFTKLMRLHLFRDRRLFMPRSNILNSLPDSLKNINLTRQTFKRYLKTFLFSTY